MRNWIEHTKVGIGLIGVFAVALMVGLAVGASVSGPSSVADASPEGLRSDSLPHRELAMIYIGSSTCGWANQPETIADVGRAQQLLRQRAADLGVPFRAIGISVDQRVADGIDHLDGIGGFDEVSVGNGWRNLGALRYAIDDTPGPLATPQLVIVERVINPSDNRAEYEPHLVTDAVLRGRKVGAEEIASWVARGGPESGGVPLQ